MYATTGFETLVFMNSAALSSSEPPISPMSITAGVGIRLEGLEAIDEVGSGNRVPADADTGGLAHPLRGELVEGLVCEGAGSAHDADGTTGERNVTGGDAYVALSWRDDAREIRPEEPRTRVIAA